MTDQPTTGRYDRTRLLFDDVACVRCSRSCGPRGAVVYLYEGEGLVCDECHSQAQSAQSEAGQ